MNAAASDGDETDLPREGRRKRARLDALMLHARYGHESKTKARRDHGQDPVVAFAFVHCRPFNLLLFKDVVDAVAEFAVDAREIALAVKRFDGNDVIRANRVAARRNGDELFLVKRDGIQAAILRPSRLRIDRDL